MKRKRIIFVVLFLMALGFTVSVAGADPQVPEAICSPSTWLGVVSADWSVDGNWSCDKVPNKFVDVVIPDVNAVPDAPTRAVVLSFPMLSVESKVKTVTIASGASLDLNGNKLIVESDMTNNGTLTGLHLVVKGNLINNGTLVGTQGIDTKGKFYFKTGNYGGVNLANFEGGIYVNPGLVTVEIKACDMGGTIVKRCYDITPTITSPISIWAQLFFAADDIPSGVTCTDLRIYHFDGPDWSLAGSSHSSVCTTEPYYSEAYDITTFSPFVVSVGEPTAVSLVDFTAFDAGQVPIVIMALLLIAGMFTVGVILIKRRRDSLV